MHKDLLCAVLVILVHAQERIDGMIRLVAVDMDGTLLGPDGRVSDRNAHVIRCMQDMGVELLICTGRSYEDALLPLEEAGLKAPVVCMNGASTYDSLGRRLDKVGLATTQVERIVESCKDEGVIFDFMTDKGSCTIALEEEFKDYFNRNVLLPMAEFSYESVRSRFTFLPPGELFRRGLEFYKVSVIHESPLVLGKLRERLGLVPDLAIASSAATNLELTHQDAQKGKALAGYAAMRNIGWNEIMAVGDSENDYSMLSMDLKYTVAMGNAMERIKKTAKCQTRTNSQDGVAYAIENLVFEGRSCRNLGSI